jgi:hypothetical protein
MENQEKQQEKENQSQDDGFKAIVAIIQIGVGIYCLYTAFQLMMV